MRTRSNFQPNVQERKDKSPVSPTLARKKTSGTELAVDVDVLYRDDRWVCPESH